MYISVSHGEALAQFRRTNTQPPTQPVADSRSSIAEPVSLQTITLRAPPRNHVQYNIGYARQIIHSYLMQGFHQQSNQSMIHCRELTCR